MHIDNVHIMSSDTGFKLIVSYGQEKAHPCIRRILLRAIALKALDVTDQSANHQS